MALLDRDGVYGAPRFHKAATAAGLRAIIGAELTIAGAEGSSLEVSKSDPVLRLQPSRPSDFALARPLRKPGGLSEPVPSDHPHENARAERRGRADAGRSGRLDPRPRRARRPRGARRAPQRRRGPDGSPRRACSVATACTSSCSGISAATRKPTTRRSSTSRRRSTCRSSRPTACALRRRPSGRCSTSSRAFITTPRSRKPGGVSRRTPSGTSSRPRTWRRSSAIGPTRLPVPASLRIACNTRWRISATGFLTTRCRRARRRRRFCGRWSRSARGIATARTTIGRARRWRASSISSRS